MKSSVMCAKHLTPCTIWWHAVLGVSDIAFLTTLAAAAMAGSNGLATLSLFLSPSSCNCCHDSNQDLFIHVNCYLSCISRRDMQSHPCILQAGAQHRVTCRRGGFVLQQQHSADHDSVDCRLCPDSWRHNGLVHWARVKPVMRT